MEQFIQYLYEYENGERVRNLGFMKVERKMDKVEIQIYSRNLDEISGIRFRKENGVNYIASWENSNVQTEKVVLPEIQESAEQLTAAVSCTCEKIQRQDLSRLPRKEWKLANNNFLLHGYYNYHHLLYIEEDDKVWIGVPGVFHPKEKIAAEGFGFPEFRRMTDLQMEPDAKDQNVEEDFGYWCRQIE